MNENQNTAGTWAHLLVGDPLASDHGTPCMRTVVSPEVYADPAARLAAEAEDRERFAASFPGHCVCVDCWDPADAGQGDES